MPTESRNLPRAFDTMAFPLSGRRLIEASAGTGKTYNIAHLYLRLVLGVGAGMEQREPLQVDEILVVTFTRAAAGELRVRIRALLETAYRDLRRRESDNDTIRAMVDNASLDHEALIRHLRDALLAMDEAAISTIHAFAVKAASIFVFETGAIDGVELSDTGDEKAERVLTDLYRRLTADKAGLGAIGELLGMPGLEDFRRFWKSDLPPALLCRPAVTGTPDQAIANLLARRDSLQADHDALAREWREAFPFDDPDAHSDGIRDVLFEALEGNASPEMKPGQLKSLASYIELCLFAPVSQFVDRSGNQYFKDWIEMTAAADAPAPVSLFLRVRDHFQAVIASKDGFKRQAQAIVLHALQAARKHIDLQAMSLDEVIGLVNRRLDDDDTRAVLQRAIAATWPVCLVDEFQDTDPEQFRMFNRIYASGAAAGPGAGLFMIGDPKQSIFAFRGADIFAYLNVRREVSAAANAEHGLYSLDTNWRSKQALVGAINELFGEAAGGDPTFVFEGIPFQPVKSCENRQERRLPDYAVGEGNPVGNHPLVFIGNPDDPAGERALQKDKLIAQFARDTARRIAALLDPDRGARIVGDPDAGDVGIDDDRQGRRLNPGDIAVLVRSAREARAVRRELARPEVGLRSVYASQRDSVFGDAEVAEDLLHLLMAIDQCTDKRRLRTALATPLMRGFDYGFDEADRIDQDDDSLEHLVAEFGGYRETWCEHGVLAALNRLFDDSRRNLLKRAAARPDSDRLLTDLRHLGDLLQQRDQDCDSPEQLIDWFAAQLEDDSAVDEDTKRIRLESDEDLVKVATIFVAKGLEYPVVFLPFFFIPRRANLNSDLPMYRERDGEAWKPVVDFEGDKADIESAMNKERLAEDMRLLYVAVTRAKYQCHVGVSAVVHGNGKEPLFADSVWGRLLESPPGDDGELPASPSWPQIRAALEARLDGVLPDIGFAEAGDVDAIRYRPPAGFRPALAAECPTTGGPVSNWRVSSYSGLVKGQAPDPGFKNDDEDVIPDADADALTDDIDADGWRNDIRYSLPGSAHTGNCLHDILEHCALAPQVVNEADGLAEIVHQHLDRYGLEAPADPGQAGGPGAAPGPERVADWLGASLRQPLALAESAPGAEAPSDGPSLAALFGSAAAVPEMRFDFAVGQARDARFGAINSALEAAGLAPLERYGEISGLMTGAIDLVFEHDKAFYVVDYKSNTLGRAPRYYDHAGMDAAIRDHRYDLQYMIYAVAAHRHFRQRLVGRYGFDGGEYRFGGVLYLFLRGMGLDGYPGYGEWFHRPAAADVDRLDRALLGAGDGDD